MHSEKKYFSIGEVAKIKNITAKTLRYYHDIGLLEPEYVDESNGYRYYTLEQLIQIDIIKIVRNIGGSIKELQNIYSHKDTEYLCQFLKDKDNEIQERIQELEETKLMIKAITDKVEESKVIVKTTGFQTRYFLERYLITSPLTETVGLEHIFDYFKLEEQMNDYNAKSKYEQGILYNASITEELKPISVFEVVDKDRLRDKEVKVPFVKLPKGCFLTYTVSGKMIEQELKWILSYIREKKINTEFILLFELYTDIFNCSDCHYEIQVYIGEATWDL